MIRKLGRPDKVLGKLRYYEFIRPETLKEISRIVPEENLENRQNYAPKFKKFLKIGEKNRNEGFSIYVVPKERWDERVTVTTIFIPKRKIRLIAKLRKYEPDEELGNKKEGKDLSEIMVGLKKIKKE